MVQRTWNVRLKDPKTLVEPFEATMGYVTDTGSLQFQKLDGQVILWIRVFAPGTWLEFSAVEMTVEQIADVKAQIETEKTMQGLALPGAVPQVRGGPHRFGPN